MSQASWLGLYPNSPHKVEAWACAMGQCTYCFLPHQQPPQPLTEASLGEGWLFSWIGCGFHVAIRGWFDLGFVAVKRLMIMMALVRFSCPFQLLLLIPLETFLVSPFSTSSAGLEASLTSVQNFWWCFLSPCLPKGRFSPLSFLAQCAFLLLRSFFFPSFEFRACWVGVPPLSLFCSPSLNHACFFWIFLFYWPAHRGKVG